MLNFRLLLLVLFSLFILESCSNPESGINTKGVKEEINNRKIRRISEAEIVEKSFEKGRKLIDTLKLLAEKNREVSADTMTRLGNLQPFADQLQQSNKAEIKKVLNTDLQGNNLKVQEKEIFEAYLYNIGQGMKVEDNVQLLDTYIFYAAPIIENGELKGMWSIYFDKGELIRGI